MKTPKPLSPPFSKEWKRFADTLFMSQLVKELLMEGRITPNTARMMLGIIPIDESKMRIFPSPYLSPSGRSLPMPPDDEPECKGGIPSGEAITTTQKIWKFIFGVRKVGGIAHMEIARHAPEYLIEPHLRKYYNPILTTKQHKGKRGARRTRV